MLTVAKDKRELNKLIKDIQVVLPEMTVNAGAMVVKGNFEGIEVFSAIKCRGGWSILLNDQFFDTRSMDEKIKSLEASLTNS